MRWGTWGAFDEVVATQLRVYRRRGVRRADRWFARHPDAWAALAAVVAATPFVAFARPGASGPVGAFILAGAWYAAARRQARVSAAAIELVDHGEEELLALDEELARARSTRDRTGAEHLLHADFVETRGVAGAIEVTRSAWLDDLVQGPEVRVEPGPREVELRPGHAVLAGDVAIRHATGTDHERTVSEWHRDGGRWLLRRRHVETLRRSRE